MFVFTVQVIFIVFIINFVTESASEESVAILCLLRYISNARSIISSLSFSLQMELFPDTITEFSRVLWLMERRLSDKIFVTKLNVRSTEELTLICSRSKRPADTGLEICRVGNVAQNNSASLNTYLKQ